MKATSKADHRESARAVAQLDCSAAASAPALRRSSHSIRPIAGRSRELTGPSGADVDVLVESIEDGAGARVTITLNFTGRGIGRLIVLLLVVRQAAHEAPRSCAKLKRLIEQGDWSQNRDRQR